MGCGTGGCSTGGGCSSGGCSSGGCNKLNTYDWLAQMDMPAYMKPFDIIEVRFKGTRKEYFKNTGNLDITNNELVVVESESGGYDIGKVSLKGELVKLQLKKAGIPDYEAHEFPKILRRANDADKAKHKENAELEVPTMYKARSIAMELGLQMKLSDVEYRGDRRKATYYYTAEERVDFRELIKRLADAFKVRIEMRQIGYRQEAGRLGAIGSCGRELCCSTWLTDFKVVHTNAARYQNLSLNPLKLSGQCGKLKCCLNYELDAYLEAWKEFPENENVVLQFSGGAYRQVKTDILKRIMWFAPIQEFGGEWLSLKVNQVKEFIQQNREGIKPDLVMVMPKKEIIKVELDFQNDMGVDSLTRLDERKSKKSKSSRNKGRGKDPQQNTAPREQQPRNTSPQQRQQGPRNTQQPRPQQNTRSQNPEGNTNQRPQQNPRNNQPQQRPQKPREQDGPDNGSGSASNTGRDGGNRSNRNRNNNNRNRNNNSGKDNNNPPPAPPAS
jgi:cell fate regulator YaaT (PSP1 superfamily)